MIRAVLATTLSGVYGIYSGFELCENAALPGREEYLDSEKYQYKQRDWNSPGNIKPLITRLNAIRRENAALQQTNNLARVDVKRDAVHCAHAVERPDDGIDLDDRHAAPAYQRRKFMNGSPSPATFSLSPIGAVPCATPSIAFS
jgi:hypothetical protein